MPPLKIRKVTNLVHPVVKIEHVVDPQCEFAQVTGKCATIGDGLALAKSSLIPDAGLGLYATRNFAKDAPITLYYGQIIEHAEAKRRPRTHIRSLVSHRFDLDGLFMEDGTPITNAEMQLRGFGGGAMANHRENSSANAEYTAVTTPAFDCAVKRWISSGSSSQFPCKGKLVYLRALRDIASGDEIYVDYGRDYWK